MVKSASELGTPDAVFLPGSKNTIADLQALLNNGTAAALFSLAEGQKTEVVGVCGGFQMLGNDIADPHGTESATGWIKALGLLDMSTTLARNKTLRAVTPRESRSNLTLQGYEIHHGENRFGGVREIMYNPDGYVCGVAHPQMAVWGSYLHGLFDEDHFRRWFLDRLRERKGRNALNRVCATYDIEQAIDRVAALVREHMDMNAVYRLLGV